MGGLLGSMTFNGLSFPVKKGMTSVSVDLSLNSHIPAGLAQTSTKVTAATKSGDQAFCIEVFTAPAGPDASKGEVHQEAVAETTSACKRVLIPGQKCNPKAWLPWEMCCKDSECTLIKGLGFYSCQNPIAQIDTVAINPQEEKYALRNMTALIV